MNNTLKLYRLKHVIPFMHQSQSSTGNSYIELQKKISQNCTNPSSNWKPVTASKKSEQDVYDYILRSLDGSKEDTPDYSICSIWNYNVGNGKELRYVNRSSPGINLAFDFKITNVELFLFSNHVGFICFEIVLPPDINDYDTFIEFQNELKEFSFTKKDSFLLEQAYKLSLMNTDIDDNANLFCGTKCVNQYNKERWIKNSCLAKVKSQFDKDLIHIKENDVSPSRKQIIFYRTFNIGVWADLILKRLLEDSSVFIEFYANRTTNINDDIIRTPDKSILFSYYVVDDLKLSEKDIHDNVFRIANGYNNKYIVNISFKDYFEPLSGIIWYASRQGCGCIVYPPLSKSKYFNGKFRTKIMDDYFILYIVLLNQMLGLAYYAKTISTSFPSDIKRYTSPDKELYFKLSTVSTELNLFLMKCVCTSVSSIQQQNEFNYYVKQQLHIEEDIDALTKGLQKLNALQDSLIKKEEEDKNSSMNQRLTISIAFLSLLAAISAICDSKALFWDNNPLTFFDQYQYHPFFDIALLIVAIISIQVVINIVIIIFSKKKKQRDQS